ncbi:Copia protein [Symbiodinium microadriaticum]|uniref:Copia protein n=1 Tax=Symbiodinium microadriaticum TaxID=2951 RepID=A0A1Q9CP88_SYMMI|nr:Copia protein [Symbiodinium microadriaticum]
MHPVCNMFHVRHVWRKIPSALRKRSNVGPQVASPPSVTVQPNAVFKNMDKMSKAHLRAAISTFGEIPAESWNMAELRHRLRELMDEQDIEWANPHAKRETPLQQQITQLNKNKKKKADLIAYLEKVLQLPVSASETMSQMENRAMNHLYSTVQSTSQDIVGFGRHASLIYAELLRDFPQYAEWVKQTHRESTETNIRLKRLATWLLRATDVSSPVNAETRNRDRMVLKVKGGYVQEPEPETAQSSGAISSRQTPFPNDQMELMHGMMETMKQMQAELKEMKEQTTGSEDLVFMKPGDGHGGTRAVLMEAQKQALSEKRRVSVDGERLMGRKIPTLGQCIEFSPQAVKGVKEVMTKMCDHDPEVTPEEALAITIMTFNHRDLVRGELEEMTTEAPRGSGFQLAEAWWASVPDKEWEPSQAAYWQSPEAAVAVEVELPGNQHGLQKTLKNLSSYFVGALKRKAVEVSERKLNEEQKAQFRAAKTVEVRNFIAAKAFETLPEGLRPSKEQAIHMRWILTWKPTEGGGQKAKARAVLLGYQDPKYEHRATTAPVMTRQTRQMQLQITAIRKWQIQKGDVSGAFLQGREYPDELFCVPCPEICQAMGLAEGTVTRLRRACYGLVDAPLEWYRTVDSFLQELGLERTQADACAWVWRPGGHLRGMISGHVDDFLFSGSAEDKGWQEILSRIRLQFKWGDWEQDRFVQCGVQVERTPEGFSLSQPQYLEGIKEIPLSTSRRKEREAATTEREKTQLRALLGAISWHAQQVGPHLSAEVSLLLSDITESTVETVVKANQLAYHARTRKDHKMLVHAFAEDEPVALFGWVDAANENRRDGGSTQGIFIGLGPASMLSGDLGKVTPIAWHSNRIDRVCRSPGAAEAQAAVNGEDALYFARFQWSELVYGQVDVRRPNDTVTKVTGCLVTDSRNVYDKLVTEVLVIKGKEKKTNIELLALKEAQRNHQVIIRWVHSEDSAALVPKASFPAQARMVVGPPG